MSKFNKKVLLTPHLHFHTKKFRFLKNIYNRLLTKRLLDKADKIICFTEYEVNYWKKQYNGDRNKLLRIPHYLECENILLDSEKLTDRKFILYLGRASINKRIDLLIKSIKNNTNLPFDFLLNYYQR